MNTSIIKKLESLQERHEEIAGLLADPDVISDQNQFRQYSVEYSQLEPVVQTYAEYSSVQDDLEATKELLQDSDSSVQEMAQQETRYLSLLAVSIHALHLLLRLQRFCPIQQGEIRLLHWHCQDCGRCFDLQDPHQ